MANLKGAVEWLDEVFYGQPQDQRQKMNNLVERANRRLRFDEMARYKWRKRKSLVRFVLLRISPLTPRPKTHGQPPLPPEWHA